MLLASLAAASASAQEMPAPSASRPGAPVARPGATDMLARFDGLWIGSAEMTGPDGVVRRFEQMERIGPMLAGEIRVMEGKARDPDGRTLFNALTVFSPVDGGIEMRSWTPGHTGARRIEPTADGYIWRSAAGPGATMIYRIAVRDGVWHEVGEFVRAGRAPVVFFRMTLRRIGDTDWPAANPAFPARPSSPR